MSHRKTIEIFSAGCPACEETIQLVNQVVCPQCDINIVDMNQAEGASRAKELGIHVVPTVVIDGALSPCCTHSGVNEAALKTAIGI